IRMPARMVKVVKGMPAQLKQIWDSMIEQSEHAVRASVSALRGSVDKLDEYLKELEREHVGAAPRRGRPPGSKNQTSAARRGHPPVSQNAAAPRRRGRP